MLGIEFYKRLRVGPNEIDTEAASRLIQKHGIIPNKKSRFKHPLQLGVCMIFDVTIPTRRDRVVVHDKFFEVIFKGESVVYKDLSLALQAKEAIESNSKE